MTCYFPIDAWQFAKGRKLQFTRPSNNEAAVKYYTPTACGQCIGCRLTRSRHWAIRCMHEARMHRDNCVITLTYDDKKLPFRNYGEAPANVSLYYDDYRLFMMRLRKRFGSGIKFYMCGEYGEDNARPHFHACIFGMDFSDKKYFMQTSAGSIIHVSEVLKDLWPFGFSSVGTLNFQSAAYIARYVMKKITGDAAADHYTYHNEQTGEVYYKTPEFNRMSNRPGIGANWFHKYYKDVFPHDHVIVNEKPVKPPRYYDKLYRRMVTDYKIISTLEKVDYEEIPNAMRVFYNPDTAETTYLYERNQLYADLKEARAKAALEHAEDNTPERLQVRHECARRNIERLKRKLT